MFHISAWKMMQITCLNIYMLLFTSTNDTNMQHFHFSLLCVISLDSFNVFFLFANFI